MGAPYAARRAGLLALRMALQHSAGVVPLAPLPPPPPLPAAGLRATALALSPPPPTAAIPLSLFWSDFLRVHARSSLACFINVSAQAAVAVALTRARGYARTRCSARSRAPRPPLRRRSVAAAARARTRRGRREARGRGRREAGPPRTPRGMAPRRSPMCSRSTLRRRGCCPQCRSRRRSGGRARRRPMPWPPRAPLLLMALRRPLVVVPPQSVSGWEAAARAGHRRGRSITERAAVVVASCPPFPSRRRARSCTGPCPRRCAAAT